MIVQNFSLDYFSIWFIHENVLTSKRSIFHRIFRSSTSQSSLYALKWSCVLIQNGLPENCDLDLISTLVGAQSALLMAVTAHGNLKKNRKAYFAVNIYFISIKTLMLFIFIWFIVIFLQLHHLWIKVGQNVEEKWLQAMNNGEGSQISVMAGALCKHLKSQGRISLFENYKVKFILFTYFNIYDQFWYLCLNFRKKISMFSSKISSARKFVLTRILSKLVIRSFVNWTRKISKIKSYRPFKRLCCVILKLSSKLSD